jgi:hypothetical protein
MMAVFCAPKELVAIRTCCWMTMRSSRARVLSSLSASGVYGPVQRARILEQSLSIRASVSEGKQGFTGFTWLSSIQGIP